MPSPSEYLEKVFAESFKRESDQEENVVRSLPFFATSLVLAASLLGFAGSALPPFTAKLWSVQFYVLSTVVILLLLATRSLSMVLWYLFAAIRPRTYILPPTETELIQWEKDLRIFHAGQGLGGAPLDDAITNDLRDLMIAEYAKAATNNRANNYARVFARSQALSSIIMGLAFAIAIVVITFIDVRVLSSIGNPPGGSNVSSATAPVAPKATEEHGPTVPAKPEPKTGFGQADPTAESVHHRGSSPAVGERDKPEGQQDTPEMTNKNTNQSAPPPTEQSGTPKPQPPASQTFERSAPTGDLQKK